MNDDRVTTDVRSRVEHALRASEERYRMLFDAIDEGFCVIEVLFDDDGQPTDYVFLETNAAFDAQTGLVDAVGKRMRDLAPHHEAHWFEIYGRIAVTGEPERFTSQARELDRWYDVYAFRVGEPGLRQVAVLFNDVTTRKRAENIERDAAEVNRFVVKLTDALRHANPIEIQDVAARLLAEQLGASRVFYMERAHDVEMEPDVNHFVIHCDYVDGVPSTVGRHRLDDFGASVAEALREGRTVMTADIGDDPTVNDAVRCAYAAIGVQAYLTVPLVKDGRLVAVLAVHQSDARVWTHEEHRLVEETAARTWAAVDRARSEQQLKQSRDTFYNLVQRSPLGVYLVDGDFRVAQVSAGAQKVFENVHPLLGRDFDEVLHIIWPEPFASEALAIFRHTLETGEPYHSQDTTEQRRDVEATESYDWQVERIAFPDGRQGVVCHFYDLTELRRSQGRLRKREAAERERRERSELLGEIITALESVSGTRRRAERLVDLIVPKLVGYACISLTENGDVVAIKGEAEDKIELPLATGRGAQGSLVVGRAEELSEREVSLLREIADRSSLPLANALLAETEHELALRLQRALLPNAVLRHPAVDIAARYQAGSGGLEVGGDWYDSFELPGGRVGLAVGDIVGHGLDAAASMGRMRTALQALAMLEPSPARVLEQLNAFAFGPDGVDFATACYAVFDDATGELTYASAGHPPMLLVDPQERTRWLSEGRSVPLGLYLDAECRQATVNLDPGSLLALYSDGLVERRGKLLSAGLDRLEVLAVALHEEPVETICAKVIRDLGSEAAADDDIVLMAARFSAASAPAFRQSYAARPEQLRRMRADLRSFLETGVPSREQGDVLLAIGEASANAIEHAYTGKDPGTVVIEIARDELLDELNVRVQDFGQWRELSDRADGRGRGTDVIKALVGGYERETGTDGTTVRFRMRGRTRSEP